MDTTMTFNGDGVAREAAKLAASLWSYKDKGEPAENVEAYLKHVNECAKALRGTADRPNASVGRIG